jgi:hypothetical protein
MAPPVRVPNKTQLRRYLSRGLTQQEIVDEWEAASSHRVSRSAIAMAIERYGLKSAHPRPTYPELLPWIIREDHRQHIDARMLRLEGRSRSGQKLSQHEQRWLDQWKHDLERAGAVVHYERDADEGFFWIARTAEHGDDLIDRSNAVKPEGRVPSGTHSP